jgi:hypothetical protein
MLVLDLWLHDSGEFCNCMAYKPFFVGVYGNLGICNSSSDEYQKKVVKSITCVAYLHMIDANGLSWDFFS